MMNEQPYDSIPNFSAADALRLTGIGRNEFIDIMNKCRSKKIMWKLNKSIAKEFLPTQPIDFAIEPWWGVCLVNFTLEEFKKLTEEEAATIDKICKEEANSYFLFDPDIIKGLYLRGLVYFDVPVYPDDRFKVSRLEGFVSNREQSYEDPIEELLYAVFVVSSENATVAELSSTLQADLFQLRCAASFACRLGWAVKLIDPAAVLGDPLKSSFPLLGDDEDSSISLSSASTAIDPSHRRRLDSGPTRICLIVDANITSYLMMGSISPGLKSHAVTLYEAGKLDDASITDLCNDLGSLEGKKFEGELQEFANHAFSLRSVLKCLQSGGNVANELYPKSSKNGNDSEINHLDIDSSETSDNNLTGKKNYQVNILRCESLASLAPATLDRLFLRDYDIVLSMTPLPSSSVLPGPNGPVHLGPPSYSSMTPWMKLVLYSTMESGPTSAILMKGQCLRMLPPPLAGCEKALIWSWDKSVVGGLGGKYEGNLVNGNILLHCLNSLLKCSAVLVQPLNKADLDQAGRPVTVDIPLPLKNFDGSVVNIDEIGVSADNNDNLNLLLHELSDRLEIRTVGFVRLLRLCKERESHDSVYDWVPLSIEFGIPLFSPELCNRICDRVVSSRLLDADSVFDHHESMKSLRKMLSDVCTEYQAMGPVAKLLYQKEQREKPKEATHRLINYASGRWTSFSQASVSQPEVLDEHQRLNLSGRRDRCRTDVLSFDGNILRSYALSPVYESEESVDESSAASSSVKSESDDSEKREVVLPGVNLLFDGTQLVPFDIGACLQARQPIMLIAEAASISASSQIHKII
ncbi:FAM91 carboxy-terminus protein isoform X2 [Wolffia australiana]